MDEQLVYDGMEVKALGDGKVGGYLVRFSDAKTPDLTGDYFTKETNFGKHQTTEVYYHHGLDRKLGQRVLDDGAVMKMDEIGVWVEAQLALRDEYEKEIYGLAEAGKLGWSSGTASHLVEREPMGKAYWIKRWPLGLDASLTPTPAEPRNTVFPLKSLFEETEPEAEEQAVEEVPQAVKVESESTIEEITPEKDKDKMEQELKDELAEMVKTAVKESLPKVEEKPVEVKQEGAVLIEAPAVKKITGLGFSNDSNDGFLHWMKTGQRNSALKTDLQEGDATEGGYLVPDDMYAGIIGKRNELSVARRAGAMVIQTSRDVVNIPVEGTQAAFAYSAEEAAYTASILEFDNVSVEVQKSTLLVKITEELLDDNATNLESWLTGYVGSLLGVHENTYTIGGNGSSQAQGVLSGGTAGLTFDDTNTIAAAEIPELFFKLKEQYMDNASWCMESATLGFLQGLSGSLFQLFTPPTGIPGWNLWGKPVYPAAAMGSYSTTANQSVVVGDWSRYAIVERSGLSVFRNPYLYNNTGHVGFFFKVRWGGAVLQSEAFQIGVQA
jgi:HK97 family phage major capsid protein